MKYRRQGSFDNALVRHAGAVPRGDSATSASLRRHMSVRYIACRLYCVHSNSVVDRVAELCRLVRGRERAGLLEEVVLDAGGGMARYLNK